MERDNYAGLIHFTCAGGDPGLLREIPGDFLRAGDTASACDPCEEERMFLWRCVRITAGTDAEWAPEQEWTEGAVVSRIENACALFVLEAED